MLIRAYLAMILVAANIRLIHFADRKPLLLLAKHACLALEVYYSRLPECEPPRSTHSRKSSRGGGGGSLKLVVNFDYKDSGEAGTYVYYIYVSKLSFSAAAKNVIARNGKATYFLPI